jgi:hypothetical protein
MNEVSNNPMQIEQYNSISATDIRGSGYSIQNLVTRQLDRINYLLTLSTAKSEQGTQHFNEQQMAMAAKRGLRTVESFLSPYINNDEEYIEETTKIKENIRIATNKGNTTEIIDHLSDWYDFLISRLGNLDMLPQRSTDIEFD